MNSHYYTPFLSLDLELSCTGVTSARELKIQQQDHRLKKDRADFAQ